MNASTATLTVRRRVAISVPTAWFRLVRREMWGTARHPLFLVGLGFVAFGYWQTLTVNNQQPDRMYPGISAAFVGLVGMGVMSLRAKSLRRSDEVVGTAPMSTTARTAALCAACLLPFSIGLALWAFELWSFQRWPLPTWMYGGLSATDRALVMWSSTAVAALGGPLLGVALGRWLRFPAGTVVGLVGVVAWVVAVGQPSIFSGHVPTWATALRLSAPYAFFTTVSARPYAMDTFPGSPGWYSLWQLALCGLAVVAALLKGAEARTRRGLLVAGVACLALGLVAYVLAFTGGVPDWLRTFPDGTTQWGVGGD